MKKVFKVTAAAAFISLMAAVPAMAGQWQQDSVGWKWVNNDGSPVEVLRDWWAWCDGNHDGIGENYYFDSNGYLSLTGQPGGEAVGITVNEAGALTENGTVVTAQMPEGQDLVMGAAEDGKMFVLTIPDRGEAAEPEMAPIPEAAEEPTQAPLEIDIDCEVLAQRIAELVNEEREARGKDALEIEADFTEAAMVRAEEISEQYSHLRPNGGSFDSAIQGHRYYRYGENIVKLEGLNVVGDAATIDFLAKQFVNAWLESPGHKKNMLYDDWTATGVGVYYNETGIYASQLFLRTEN